MYVYFDDLVRLGLKFLFFLSRKIPLPPCRFSMTITTYTTSLG